MNLTMAERVLIAEVVANATPVGQLFEELASGRQERRQSDDAVVAAAERMVNDLEEE